MNIDDSENVTFTIPEVLQSSRNSRFSRIRSSSFSEDEEQSTSPPPNKRSKNTVADPQVDLLLYQEFVEKSTNICNSAVNKVDDINNETSNIMEVDNTEVISSLQVSPATPQIITNDHVTSSMYLRVNSNSIPRDATEKDCLDNVNIDSEEFMSNACSQSSPINTTNKSSDKHELSNMDAKCKKFENHLRAIKQMTYQCEMCDKRFKKKITLRIHTEMMHVLEISE